MSRLLLLAPISVESQDVIAAAARLGHEVRTVSHRGSPPHDLPPEVVEDLVVDFSDVEAASRITEHAVTRRIDGILTTREFLTPLVARVCADLSLRGNDVTLADGARNKIAMAEQFARFEVSAPRTFVVDREAAVDDLVCVGQLSFPVVVKPAENAGSMGVSVVESSAGLPVAFQRVWNQESAYDLVFDDHVVVQEYVEGDEFSVESVTRNGWTQHICVTRKVTTGRDFRVEIGHSVQARLDGAIRARILTEVDQAIRAVGIRDSVSHTEVKVRPDGGCTVIEIAARMGGGRIGVLVDLALGVSIPELAVSAALGDPVDVVPTRNACAAVRLLLPPAEARLVGLENLPSIDGEVPVVSITRPIGTKVRGPRSNKGRIGHFIVLGTDEPKVNTRADHLLNRIEITVEPT